MSLAPMGNRLRYLITAVALMVLVVFAIQKVRTSPDWQHFDEGKFFASLAQLRIPELLGAILLIFLTYYLRSLRWYEFLRPVKHTSIPHLFTSTVLGFGAVAVFGRPGELVRPYLIARQEDLPASGQLAVWILERFYDGVALILLVGAAIFFSGSADEAGGEGALVLGRMRHAGVILMLLTIAGVTLLVLYERHLKTWEPKLLDKLRFLPARLARPVRDHLVSFAHGLACVRSFRALAMGALYSVAIWMTIAGSFWLTLQAFGSPVDDLSFAACMLVMGFAIGGSIIQLPGVGGGSQLFAILALTELYGVPPEVATSAGLVLWGQTFLAVIPLAVILCATQGLTWNRLRAMTRPGSPVSLEERTVPVP